MQILNTIQELKALLEKERSVYLYGAGMLSDKIIAQLPNHMMGMVKGAIVTEKASNRDYIENGVPVVEIAHIRTEDSQTIIICTGSAYLSDVEKELKNRGLVNYWAISAAWEQSIREMDELEFRMQQRLWRTTRHYELEYLTVNIVEHCNLNCAGCDHFSSISDSFEESVDSLQQNMSRIGKIMGRRLKSIGIMGGEPLLHSDIVPILRSARSAFPDCRILLYTNCTLIDRQQAPFWDTCHECEIVINATEYPISLDYRKIEEIVRSHGVEYASYDTWEPIKTLYHSPLDLKGEQNPIYNFMDCYQAQSCAMLSRGKLWPCTVAGNIHIFNKKFDQRLSLTERDYLDIRKIENADEVMSFLSRPIPLCRYCNVKGRTRGNVWHTSEGKIEEWT